MGPDAYASLISFDFDLMASIVVSGVARIDDLSQKRGELQTSVNINTSSYINRN